MVGEKKRLGAAGLTSAIIGAVLGLYALVLLVWIAIAGAFTDDALKQALSPRRIFTNINNSDNTDFANSLANAGTLLGITNIIVFVLFGLALLIGLFSLISVLTKGTLGLKVAQLLAGVGTLLAIVGVTLWFAVATTLNEGLGILGFRYADDGFTIFHPVAALVVIVGVVVLTVLTLLPSGRSVAPAADSGAVSEPSYVDAGYSDPGYGAHAGLPTPTAVYEAPVNYQAPAAYEPGPAPGPGAGDAAPTTALPVDALDEPSPYGPPEPAPAADSETTRPIGIVGSPAEPVQPEPVQPEQVQPDPTPDVGVAPPAPPAPAGSQRPFARADGEYFLHIGGAEYGPYSAAQIAEFADEGRINESTQIRPAQGYYEPASVVPGLFT